MEVELPEKASFKNEVESNGLPVTEDLISVDELVSMTFGDNYSSPSPKTVFIPKDEPEDFPRDVLKTPKISTDYETLEISESEKIKRMRSLIKNFSSEKDIYDETLEFSFLFRNIPYSDGYYNTNLKRKTALLCCKALKDTLNIPTTVLSNLSGFLPNTLSAAFSRFRKLAPSDSLLYNAICEYVRQRWIHGQNV